MSEPHPKAQQAPWHRHQDKTVSELPSIPEVPKPSARPLERPQGRRNTDQNTGSDTGFRRVLPVPSDHAHHVVSALRRYANRLRHRLKVQKNWFLQEFPDLSDLSKIERMMPRIPLSETWTFEDRQQAEEAWLTSEDRKVILEADYPDAVQKLYISALVFMGCSPEDIIGCRTHLAYDPSQDHERSGTALGAGWDATFCNALSSLIVHPMFAESPWLLALAIHYAVTLLSGKTVDVKWESVIPTPDAFVGNLLRLKRLNPHLSLVNLRGHALTRLYTWRKSDRFGCTIRPTWSPWNALFGTMELNAKGMARQNPGQAEAETSGPQSTQTLLVHAQHLELVISSLNSLRYAAYPVFLPVSVYSRVADGSIMLPPRDQFLRLLEYAMLLKRERVAYDALVAGNKEVQATESVEPGEDGDDSDSVESVIWNPVVESRGPADEGRLVPLEEEQRQPSNLPDDSHVMVDEEDAPPVREQVTSQDDVQANPASETTGTILRWEFGPGRGH
jgi:hypothetical protein